MKKKIGTIIDEAIYRRLCVQAASAGRSISDLIEAAIAAYLSVHEGSADERLAAFHRFTSPRHVLSRAQLDMVLEEDVLDQ